MGQQAQPGMTPAMQPAQPAVPGMTQLAVTEAGGEHAAEAGAQPSMHQPTEPVVPELGMTQPDHLVTQPVAPELGMTQPGHLVTQPEGEHAAEAGARPPIHQPKGPVAAEPSEAELEDVSSVGQGSPTEDVVENLFQEVGDAVALAGA